MRSGVIRPWPHRRCDHCGGFDHGFRASMYGLVFASLGSAVQGAFVLGTGLLLIPSGAYRYRARHCRAGWAGELVVAVKLAAGNLVAPWPTPAVPNEPKRKPLLPKEEEEQSPPDDDDLIGLLLHDGLRL